MGEYIADSNFDAAFQVLVIGGCYGGLAAALNLFDLCGGRAARCGGQTDGNGTNPIITINVTIIDERDGFYHLIGSPLALATESYAEKAWVKFSEVPALQHPNIKVVQGRAGKVDCSRKVATVNLRGIDETLNVKYDYLVVASGLRRVWPVVPQSLLRKQYLFEAGNHIKEVAASRHGVVIVGGGAVGIEMAAELKLVQPHINVTLAHSRNKLISSEPLPDEAKDCALDLTKEAGVNVLLEHRLQNTKEIITEDGTKELQLTFSNGHTMLADKVVMAISRSIPSTDFLPESVLNPEGYVKAQASLNFPRDAPNSEDHFAVGDLILWSGIKRCGGAMHQGTIAAKNIHELMLQKISGHKPELLRLGEIPPMIGLAVGRKAMSYGPDNGVNSGVDVAKIFFGDDLGFTICWNYLKLGEGQIPQLQLKA